VIRDVYLPTGPGAAHSARHCGDVGTATREDFLQLAGSLETFWGNGEPERALTLRTLHHRLFFEELASAAFIWRRSGESPASLRLYSQPEVPSAYVHLVATHEQFRRPSRSTRRWECIRRGRAACRSHRTT
jgi:hypothetical protein